MKLLKRHHGQILRSTGGGIIIRERNTHDAVSIRRYDLFLLYSCNRNDAHCVYDQQALDLSVFMACLHQLSHLHLSLFRLEEMILYGNHWSLLPSPSSA